MDRCLQLARLGAGNVAPNPMVGAVLVYRDRVIGEGYHKQYGQAHAEVNCVNSVAEEDKILISKSTMYVSLEPCAHYGKTPPCVDLIIANKIPEVIIGCTDSYEEVDGKGIAKLKAHGVNVVTGILEKEALEMNKRFFTFYQKQRPYIILKWAQSDNGKIAGDNGERIFISNEITNRLVHKWRSEEAAILVGKNTALKDDPELTTRLWKGNNPVRLVIDKQLELSVTLKIFNEEASTIIFNCLKDDKSGNNLFIKIKEDKIIEEILAALYLQGLQSVIIEGGAGTLQSFIDAGLWDEARIITNTSLVIEKGLAAPVLQKHSLQKASQIFSDSIGYYTKDI